MYKVVFYWDQPLSVGWVGWFLFSCSIGKKKTTTTTKKKKTKTFLAGVHSVDQQKVDFKRYVQF